MSLKWCFLLNIFARVAYKTIFSKIDYSLYYSEWNSLNPNNFIWDIFAMFLCDLWKRFKPYLQQGPEKNYWNLRMVWLRSVTLVRTQYLMSIRFVSRNFPQQGISSFWIEKPQRMLLIINLFSNYYYLNHIYIFLLSSSISDKLKKNSFSTLCVLFNSYFNSCNAFQFKPHQ